MGWRQRKFRISDFEPGPNCLVNVDTNVASKAAKILLVDDSRIVRASLARHLGETYELRVADDGESAWQTLLLDAGVQVVVTDLSMPGLDGWGLLDRVRRSRLRRMRDMPVILVSASDDPQERVRARECGANAYCVKGAPLELLENAIVKALADQRARLTSQEAGQAEDPLALAAWSSWERARAKGQDIAVLCMRLDPIPAGGPTLDHYMRERVSAQLMRQLAAAVRRDDQVVGGDLGEFWILAAGTSAQGAVAFAVRLLAAVVRSRLPASLSDTPVRLSASFGIASSLSDNLVSLSDARRLAGERATEAQKMGVGAVVAPGHAFVAELDADPANCPDVMTALAWIKAGRSHEVLPYLNQLEEEIKPLLGMLRRL